LFCVLQIFVFYKAEHFFLNDVCISERTFSLVLSRFCCFLCLDFDVESFLIFNFERGMFFFDNYCSSLVLEDDFENSGGCIHDEDNMLVHVGGECLVTKTMPTLI